jgi:glycosyltransferase involved in cell wall biosynthesis
VVSYYKLAHLYLHLSEHEGFFVPLLEGFYAGLPVVAYAAGAVPETMAGAGLLVHRRDPLQVAALIDAVLGDEELRARLLAGQRRVLRTHTRENRGQQLLELLGESA